MSPRIETDTVRDVLFICAALVVVLVGVQAASVVLVPFLLALFLAIICNPLIHSLMRWRLPQWFAILLVLATVFFLGFLLARLVGQSLTDLTRSLPQYQRQLGVQLDVWIETLAVLNVQIDRQQVLAYLDPSVLMGMSIRLLGGLGGVMGNAFFILLTVVFMLLEAASIPGKVHLALHDPDMKLRQIDRFIEAVNHYLAIKTAISLGTGLLVGLMLWLLDVKYYVLWGVMAFLLNYVPNIGSIIAALPVLAQVIVLQGPMTAVLVAAGYLSINTVMGSIIEPRWLGRGLGLSTLVVFLSLMFWGWLLGPVGMLLSVPLTIIVKIALESTADGRWLAVLLGPAQELERELEASSEGGAPLFSPAPPGHFRPRLYQTSVERASRLFGRAGGLFGDFVRSPWVLSLQKKPWVSGLKAKTSEPLRRVALFYRSFVQLLSNIYRLGGTIMMSLTPNTPESGAEPWRSNLRGDLDAELAGPRPVWWWTGLAPQDSPGRQPDGTLTSLPQPNLATCTRQQALDYFNNGWTLTETLFSGLQGEEAFFRPPYHHLRHPMIFYYGHPPALYTNKLRVAGLIEQPLDPYFERLFETGVDEMRWDDMSKNTMRWPSIQEVHAYRQQVYRTVRHAIETHPGLASGHPPITQDHPLWALFMGFEHERIHLETSAVLIHELPLNLVRRPAEWPKLHPSAGRQPAVFPPRLGRDYPANALIGVPGQPVTLGKPADWPSFGWDNEYGRRETTVQPFQASRQLVSNGEFHAFVVDGGYRERRYWSDTGWEWRTFRNLKQPTFWVPDGPAGLNRFRLRTLFEVIDMPWDWPVEVNYHEAKAYCAWCAEQAGGPYRLPSEAEHQALRAETQRRAATLGVESDPVMNLDGATLIREQGWNLNLACGSSSPVAASRPTELGFHDVFGNVWQWLEDHFNPLPGARIHPYYDDFSTPCYDGQHQMMLGGSWVSTGDEASLWARFHFRPHFFQHAGFRLVRSAGDGGAVRLDQAGTSGQVYEDPQVLNEYLLLHYGAAQEQMPHAFGPRDATDFPVRCARWLLDAAREYGAPTEQALDVGCAVGRSSFELARGYDDVLGVDLSRAFIDAADALRRDGELRYFRKDEGRLGVMLNAMVDPAIDRSRVSFRQADAGALPAELEGFDAVLLANLLCRLPSPKALLGRLGGPRGLVKPGGLLAIFSPYSWLESFTPPEAWLGGYERDGQPVRTATALGEFLRAEGFEMLREADEPLVIREHARKYQYIVAHATLWRRVE